MQKFHNDGLFSESLPLMNELRQEGTFCDVTLKVEDQSFSAHRIILAGTIPYFRAMFTNNMAESRMEEITRKEIDPCALESLISYAYTATIEIDRENAQNLLVGASFLQMDKVRDACADFLASHLDAHDVLGLRQWGDSLDCNNLVQAADKYINRHFSEITESQEFLLLTSDQIIEIIQRDELEVDTDEIVFEACMRWVRYNGKKRSEQFPAVFSKVRLPLLTPHFLVDHVCNEEFVEKSPECKKLVEEAMIYHMLPERRPQLQSFRTKPRYAYPQIFVIGPKRSRFVTVDIFDPLTGSLTKGPSIEVNDGCVSRGVAVGAKVYVFSNKVLIYDYREKIWSKGCSMSSPLSEVAVAALKYDIYLCGGSYQQPSKTVRCFCTKTGVLKTVAEMLQGRERASAICLNKFIYVLGGSTERGVSNTVERYDSVTNTWIHVSSMLNARTNFSTAVLFGKLYACGGHDGCSNVQSVEVYDPAMNTWKLITPMNCKRSSLGLVTYANKLWAIGGYDGKNYLNSFEVYDPETNKWAFELPMNIPKSCIGAGVVPA